MKMKRATQAAKTTHPTRNPKTAPAPPASRSPQTPPNPQPRPKSRQATLRSLSLLTAKIKAASAGDPRPFRRHLRLDPSSRLPFAAQIQPWQEADFAALDAGWRLVAGLTRPGGRLPTRRAFIERPRGHAKTADMAVQIAWALLFARRTLRGVAAAADREQAALISDAVRLLVRANPGLCDALTFRQNEIANPATGSRLDLISSDVASSYGLTPDFVICDELCHWPREELWYSLASSAAKKAHCLLAVLTNAGAGRGWQWQARETARTHADWHFSSLDGSQAPWVRAEDLAEQKAFLPPAVFDRLWNNRWQDAAGDFLTSAEVAACRDERLVEQRRGRSGLSYVAAIDYAEKQDLTAAVILHRESDRLVIDRLDVAVPRVGAPVLVDWVEAWIARAAAAFPQVTFVLDEHQLLGTLQRLASRHRFVRFPFAAGKGNHGLALTLRRLVVHRQIGWYPGCGARPDDPADDLERELASLVLKQSMTGSIRFDQAPGSHDDRAFVVAAAAWQATTSPPRRPLWHVALPGRGGLI